MARPRPRSVAASAASRRHSSGKAARSTRLPQTSPSLWQLARAASSGRPLASCEHSCGMGGQFWGARRMECRPPTHHPQPPTHAHKHTRAHLRAPTPLPTGYSRMHGVPPTHPPTHAPPHSRLLEDAYLIPDPNAVRARPLVLGSDCSVCGRMVCAGDCNPGRQSFQCFRLCFGFRFRFRCQSGP
jgi:hypothetical protein